MMCIKDLIVGISIGGLLTIGVQDLYQSIEQYKIHKVTDKELSADHIAQSIPTMTIVISTVDPMEWVRLPIEKNALSIGHHVSGYTLIDEIPCHIYLPSDGKARIHAMPSEGEATFLDNSFANTLAHEWLHCIRGSWHPNYHP